MYRVTRATSPNPEDDFINPSSPDYWTKTNNAANVGSFSAICLLYAKELSQRLGNKVLLHFDYSYYLKIVNRFDTVFSFHP